MDRKLLVESQVASRYLQGTKNHSDITLQALRNPTKRSWSAGELKKMTLPETNSSHLRLMVVRGISFCEGLFSGAMLVSGGVIDLTNPPILKSWNPFIQKLCGVQFSWNLSFKPYQCRSSFEIIEKLCQCPNSIILEIIFSWNLSCTSL